MTRSATDVMRDIVYAAVADAIAAMKAASKGVPNTLLRDLNAVHANATFADLPAELQAAIQASVGAAFSRLLREGYVVAPSDAVNPRPPRRDAPRPGGGGPGRGHVRGGRPPRGSQGGHKPGGNDGNRPNRSGRPPRAPRPNR